MKIDITLFFSAEVGPISTKFRRLAQNVMSSAVIRIPIWRAFGGIQWYVMPEPPATLQGAATGRIQWHVIPEPRITFQGAATW